VELRVNDFETVRQALNPPFTTRREGLSALDRIEAEVERLRAALEQIEHRIAMAQGDGLWCDQRSEQPDPERVKVDGFIEDTVRAALVKEEA